MSTESVNTDELTALKLLAAGHSIAFTAAASGLTEVETTAVARQYGNRPGAIEEAVQEEHARIERALRNHLNDSELDRRDATAERHPTG